MSTYGPKTPGERAALAAAIALAILTLALLYLEGH